MTAIEITMGIVACIMALFLIIAVLLQSGKDTGLSGTIAGGADTFFSKAKSGTWDHILSKLTVVIASVFAVFMIVMYAIVG